MWDAVRVVAPEKAAAGAGAGAAGTGLCAALPLWRVKLSQMLLSIQWPSSILLLLQYV